MKDKRKEQEEELKLELLSNMFDDGEDIIDVTSEHLDTMMPYYNEVEILAGRLAPKYFDGKFRFRGK